MKKEKSNDQNEELKTMLEELTIEEKQIIYGQIISLLQKQELKTSPPPLIEKIK